MGDVSRSKGVSCFATSLLMRVYFGTPSRSQYGAMVVFSFSFDGDFFESTQLSDKVIIKSHFSLRYLIFGIKIMRRLQENFTLKTCRGA